MSEREVSTTTVNVQKRDWRGVVRYGWQGYRSLSASGLPAAPGNLDGPGEPMVGDLQFVRGDRFLEYYYPGKGYAIWQVEQKSGELKGWYCNISRPIQLVDGMICFDDLLLDVLVYPDGRYVVLDRDELEQARVDGLPDADVRAAESTLQLVLELIVEQRPPFRFSQAPRETAEER